MKNEEMRNAKMKNEEMQNSKIHIIKRDIELEEMQKLVGGLTNNYSNLEKNNGTRIGKI